MLRQRSSSLYEHELDSASKMNQQAFMSAQISIKNQTKPLVQDKVMIGKVLSYENFDFMEEEVLDGWVP